jgi:hypothetical protein
MMYNVCPGDEHTAVEHTTNRSKKENEEFQEEMVGV